MPMNSNDPDDADTVDLPNPNSPWPNQAYAVELEAMAVTREAYALEREAGGSPFAPPWPGPQSWPLPPDPPHQAATLSDLLQRIEWAIQACTSLLEQPPFQDRVDFIESVLAALEEQARRVREAVDVKREPRPKEPPPRRSR
jgi:hypothetical protein